MSCSDTNYQKKVLEYSILEVKSAVSCIYIYRFHIYTYTYMYTYIYIHLYFNFQLFQILIIAQFSAKYIFLLFC